MKLFVLFLAGLVVSANATSQLFTQNFDKSANLADYTAKAPNAGQFNVAAGTGKAEVTIVNGKMRLAKTAGGDGRPYILRNTAFDKSAQFVAVSFKIKARAQGDATAYLGLGSGYMNDPLPDSLQKSYVRFLFHLLPDGFSIRNSNQGQEGPNKYAGEQQITLILNNSGGAKTYTAPDGSVQSVANDQWDLWVGNTREFMQGTCTNAHQKVENLKFSILSSIAEVLLDDIVIKDLSAQ